MRKLIVLGFVGLIAQLIDGSLGWPTASRPRRC